MCGFVTDSLSGVKEEIAAHMGGGERGGGSGGDGGNAAATAIAAEVERVEFC